mgnify:CR=1 FL=1
MNNRNKTPWYEALYEDFPDYDQEPYTQNTAAEVDFLLEELPEPDRKVQVLDLGCGTGRHSIALARVGYAVTGLDLSEELLQQARAKSEDQNLPVNFQHGDARELPFREKFDAVLMLCEGGFSLVETDAMDREILAGIFRALKPGGGLWFTAPSAVGMLADLEAHPDFDPVTFREEFTLDIEGRDGNPQTLACSQRYYIFPELKCILEHLGFTQVKFFAVTGSGYQRGVPLSGDHFELGVSAVKHSH